MKEKIAISKYKVNKINYKYITIFLITLLVQPIFSWDLKKEKNGVKVFTRSIEGSNFKEFKSVGTHTGSISSLIGVLQDDNNFCNWLLFNNIFKFYRMFFYLI